MDAGLQVRLAEFRQKVQQKTVRYWTNPNDLGTAITTSYVRLIKTHPAEGWVKARYARTQEEAERTARLLEQVHALEKELTALRALGVHDTRGLAQGSDPVGLTFTFRRGELPAQESFLTNWDAVFSKIGAACISRPTENSLKGILASWIYEETGSHLDQIEVVDDDFAMVKVQFFALGLIEVDKESTQVHTVGVGAKTTFQRVWRLTDRGRITLANLVGRKRSDHP